MSNDELETFEVAVTVFCRARGVDRHDAGMGAMMALQQTLGNVEWAVTARGEVPVQIANVIEAGMAGGNGYVWTHPTRKAFRDRRLPPLPKEKPRQDRVLGAEQDGGAASS